jgi:hypothetical protein
MSTDKIFVLILTIGFVLFIVFLAWNSRKNQSAEKSVPEPPPAEPEPTPEPPKKSRRSSRRR